MEKECNPCQEPPHWEEFWQMPRQLVEHRSDAVAPLDVFTNDASPLRKAEALRFIMENSFYVLLPYLLMKIGESYDGSQMIARAFWHQYGDSLENTDCIKEMCRDIACQMETAAQQDNRIPAP